MATPVAGTYDVTLSFVETQWAAKDKRVFSVSAQGVPIITSIDIYKEAGAFTALKKQFPVKVTGRVLRLDFTAEKDVASIAGIKVVQTGVDPTAPTTPTTPAATTPATPTTPAATTPAVTPVAASSKSHTASIGFDATVDGDLDEIAANMDQSNADTVAISAGRVDWTTFKWSGHDEALSSDVADDGIDYFGRAVDKLGANHKVSAVVDVYVERLLTENPSRAAIDTEGKPSTSQFSTSAMADGSAGAKLAEMMGYLAQNYDIDSIDITEMDSRIFGYGADDKASYLKATSRTDWPRNSSGGINIDDPSVGLWRSQEMAKFVAKAAGAVHAAHKELYVDVKVSWDDMSLNARQFGQDYDLMLGAGADKLVLWDYFGLSNGSDQDTAALVKYISTLEPGKYVLSIGLWADAGVVSASDMTAALKLGESSDLAGTWVTPYELSNDTHWTALHSLWG